MRVVLRDIELATSCSMQFGGRNVEVELLKIDVREPRQTSSNRVKELI